MEEPYYHAALFTFPSSAVHYITSTDTANDQGVEYTPPTRMSHTCSSLISYFVEDSDDNISNYHPLYLLHQVPMDYIEPKSTWSTNMATPSGRSSTITPADKSQSPYMIPSSEGYICSEPPLPITTYIQPAPLPPTEDPTTEASYETLHKNFLETLSIRNINQSQKYATNLPTVPPSSTPAPCKNRTQFESLNIHRIFVCCQFRNQKHLTAGIIPSTIGSFATIPNPPNRKPIQKQRQCLDKVHMDTVFGDCVALGGNRYTLLLVYAATRYYWLYGMSSLSSTSITSALENIKSEARQLPKRFYSKFDRKLIVGNALL